MDTIEKCFLEAITAELQKLNLDQAELERKTEEVLDKLPELVTLSADAILRTLRSRARAMLRRRRKDSQGFERRTYKRWRRGIDLLEVFIAISQEAGHDFNATFRPQACKDNDTVFDVLTRLHARACQISSEILTLLRGGYADGAHARWRTLHEVAVTALFVSEHGQDVANRYLLHEAVESYKAAIQYQKCCARLAQAPYSQEEMARFKANRDEICDHFVAGFENRYGWASKALTKTRPSFSDLEENVELDHLRPYYRMASHNVHSNPKGIAFRLGTAEVRDDVLLAGPSDAGLTDPAHSCAISLNHVNVALLKTRINMDRLVVLQIMQNLVGEIGQAFLEADSVPEPGQEGGP
jgi:hypothetical protein